MSGIDMNKRENFFNELNALLIKHGVCIDSLAKADDDSGLASEVCVYEIVTLILLIPTNPACSN